MQLVISIDSTYIRTVDKRGKGVCTLFYSNAACCRSAIVKINGHFIIGVKQKYLNVRNYSFLPLRCHR